MLSRGLQLSGLRRFFTFLRSPFVRMLLGSFACILRWRRAFALFCFDSKCVKFVCCFRLCFLCFFSLFDFDEDLQYTIHPQLTVATTKSFDTLSNLRRFIVAISVVNFRLKYKQYASLKSTAKTKRRKYFINLLHLRLNRFSNHLRRQSQGHSRL